jgi:hypothetical protein
MPSQPQAIAQPAQRIGHAVDFRCVGFSDQGDVQGFTHDSQFQRRALRLRGGWVMDL